MNIPSAAMLERRQAISRTSIVGAVLNLILSAVKILVGILGHSQALVADGIHSLSDLLSDLLVYVAGHHASQQPDQDHPYGHARYETVATLALGILLLLVAVGIGWDAIQRLFKPESLLQPGALALGATLLSIGLKEWLYWWTLGHARRVNSDLLRANAWHHRSDAISSIVVLIGIIGTMAGLTYLDAIAAIIVALMIAHIAWGLGWGAVHELVDTGLESERIETVAQTICSVGGVRDIHMLRTRRLGGQVSADVHVLVDPDISVSEGHMISVLVEQRLKREISDIVDVTVHIDPEDDADNRDVTPLPLRAEALARLASCWSGIPAANERERVLLHYLGGRIEVEVFFPLLACRRAGADPERLGAELTAALKEDPAFGRVRVYFG
ncbi:cation diffusion facilitator family transporter [Thermochromatium tepidum]|uniref:Cation diffusion facilitator family transporter n=1 Tax=Thermochromatium tepidum ATCC 43061 TaxID=316276 RepID=A0A6I6EJJ7_THETI|nr:cation diffusion facilitator family transporter [Thermochromatium tepidum]QGU33287.1 cation diffusion facilitator family transporter [Thermochromatium tepidum ATCC 43061]